ncbi:MAG: glycosyltransferase [Candidatus Omnitrophota bacterium]
MTPSTSSSAKILILHANAGAGHRKAAEAVFNGLKARGFTQASIVDALDHTNSFFKKAYPAGYEYMVGKLPKLWAAFFAVTDKDWAQPVFQGTRRIYNGLNAAPLVRMVKEGKFDVIVTAHFLSTEVIGDLRASGQLPGTKLVAIVTDYDVHKIWYSKGVDLYLVACDYTKKRLAAIGIPPERIAVTGIPLDEKFIVARDRAALCRKIGLRENTFTVLLSTSSFGMGPIEELAALLHDQQMIIITGNNKALCGRLTAKANPLHKVFGFVDNMEELMAVADVMLTKPGGLSVTEALANALPLIFFSAIPGQEAGNVKVLAQSGVGLSDKSLPEIAAAIKAFAADPAKLAAARAASRALARPKSVEAIIQHIVTGV